MGSGVSYFNVSSIRGDWGGGEGEQSLDSGLFAGERGTEAESNRGRSVR